MTNKVYSTKLAFKGRYFDVSIIPVKDDGYDIEVIVDGSLSGDDFCALRQYLDNEGYFDAAKKFLNK